MAQKDKVKGSIEYTKSMAKALEMSRKQVENKEKEAEKEAKVAQKEEEATKNAQEKAKQEEIINEELAKQLEKQRKMQMLDAAISGIDKFTSGIKRAITGLTAGLGKAFGFVLTNVLGLQAGFNLKEMLDQGNAVIENANLMAVSFDAVTDEYGKIDMAASTYYKKALDFQDQLHNKMQLQIAELSQTQATFNYMFSNQGINQDLATRMSNNLTGMSQDLASLYNKEFKEQAQAIQSGLTGMTKSLRLEGIDISNASLQGTLDRHGIDATASSLNYANKELLRYITLWEQTNKAQGDFARTSTSSANQMKMLQNQIAQTGAMIGMIFAQAFMKVSAYIRAIVMVVQNFVKMIGNLFGVDWGMTGIESAIGSYEGLSDAADDVGSSIGGASKKAKEFKKQLMGFDEINNITPPTQSGGGGGGGAGGGGADITDKLLPLIKDWDTHMESIRDKAQEYADKIMEALGFTKKLNGEWEWNWKNVSPTLKKIGAALGIIGAAIIGTVGNLKLLKLALKAIKFVEWAKDIPWLSGALESIKTTLGKLPSIISSIGTKIGGLAGLATWIAAIAVAITDIVIIVKTLAKSYEGFYVIAERVLSGNISLWQGMGESIEVIMQNLATSVNEVFMGTLEKIVRIFNKDAAVGFAEWAGIATKSAKDAANELDKLRDSIKGVDDSSHRQMASLKADEIKLDKYCDALEQVIDADGKVKEGKEEIAKYVLGELSKASGQEYKLVDGQVYINGKLAKTTDDVRSSLKKLIEEQKNKIKVDSIQAKLSKTIEKQAEVNAKILELEAEKLANGNKLSKEKEDQLKTLNQEYKILTNDVQKYQDDLALNTAMNMGLINTEVVESLHNLTDNAEDMHQLLTDNINNQYDTWLETYRNLTGQTDSEIKYLKQKMLELSTDTDNLTENMVKAWNTCSKESSDVFIDAISSMDEENAKKILEIINVTNENAPAVAQAYATLGLGGTEAFREKIENLEPNTRKAILNAYAAANPDKGEGSTFVAQMGWLAYKGTKGFDDWLNDPNNGLDATTKQAINDAKQELYDNGGKFKEGGKYDGKMVVEGVKENKVDAASVIENNPQTAKSKGSWLANMLIIGIGSLTIPIKGFSFKNGALSSLTNVLSRTLSSINPFASGGFPTKGQFFVAREAGPELVGNIGSRSAVMNNMQIVAAVSGGVARAVSSVLASGGFTMTLPELPQNGFGNDPQMASSIADAVISGLREQPLTADVNINAHTDKSVIFEEAANGIQEYTNRTGELPFDIPL